MNFPNRDVCNRMRRKRERGAPIITYRNQITFHVCDTKLLNSNKPDNILSELKLIDEEESVSLYIRYSIIQTQK